MQRKSFHSANARQEIPPLTDPTLFSEKELYHYFSTPLVPEQMDHYPRQKNKIQTPRPIKSLYKLFKECTPEQKYYSALRLLLGWNDPNIQNAEITSANLMENLTQIDPNLSQHLSDKLIDKTLNTLYPDVDSLQRQRLKATMQENMKKYSTNEVKTVLKDDFITREKEAEDAKLKPDMNEKFVVKFSSPPQAIKPKIHDNTVGIDIPLQENVILQPYQSKLTDSKLKFFIPLGYFGQISVKSDPANLSLYVFPGVVDNDYTDNIKLVIKNITNEVMFLQKGSSVAQLLIIPVIQPELESNDDINQENSSFDNLKKLSNANINTPIPPSQIELSQITVSVLHEVLAKVPPTT